MSSHLGGEFRFVLCVRAHWRQQVVRRWLCGWCLVRMTVAELYGRVMQGGTAVFLGSAPVGGIVWGRVGGIAVFMATGIGANSCRMFSRRIV